jgi:hypothetical protein
MEIPLSTKSLNVTANDLAFYYPKIAKAVGHNRALFPFPVLTAKEIKDNPRLMEPLTQATKDLAARILNGTISCGTPSHHRAQQLLEGFVHWLDGSAFKYVQGGKFENVAPHITDDAKQKKYTEQFRVMGTAYNLFASVKSPLGNCEQATSALAYLFLFNGFRSTDLELCMIGGSTAKGPIFFKGEKNLLCRIIPSVKRTLVPVYELSTAGGTIKHHQLSTLECDQPFDNHWVLKWRGVLYDALYRCWYQDPSEAFYIAKCTALKQVTIPPHSANTSTIHGIMPHVESKKVIVAFGCDKLSGAIGAATGPDAINYAMFDMIDGSGSVRMQQDTTNLPPIILKDLVSGSVPLKAGRVFGWCVPDDEGAARNLLMNAVTAYENSLNIFRVSSDESKVFCRLARKWCGKTKTVPKNRIYSSMTQTDWDACKLWTEQDARKAIYDAMYARVATVGTTLRRSLWEAFDVPSIFRS